MDKDIMIDLTIITDIARKKLTGFISSELSRAGFKRAVIGVSGGIDSALACFLAAEALGAENVLAVRLPYKTSSPESLEHAQDVIEATGVQSLTIPISEMADTLMNRFPEMDAMRRGNIMARVRMIVLYDQSAAFNGLVVGTGNKTEIVLGYTTLYGDSACALNPIGGLYKTQVRQLSRVMGIPQTIIDKPPSADLWSGQTDEGELGYTYEEVDRLLFLLIDQSVTPSKCIEAGFKAPFVETVLKRIQRNQFKRELPPIAKLDDPGV
jgi:NAD+ synthase